MKRKVLYKSSDKLAVYSHDGTLIGYSKIGNACEELGISMKELQETVKLLEINGWVENITFKTGYFKSRK